jgi:hypothetical protein
MRKGKVLGVHVVRRMGEWGFGITRSATDTVFDFRNEQFLLNQGLNVPAKWHNEEDTKTRGRHVCWNSFWFSATCFPDGESPLATTFKGNRNTLAFVWDFLLKFIPCTLDVTAVSQRPITTGCSNQSSRGCQNIKKYRENDKTHGEDSNC